MPIPAIIAAIRAWGFWATAQEALASAWRWLLSDLWRLACAAALVALGAQTLNVTGLYLRPHIGPVGVTIINWRGWRPRALVAEAALAARAVAEAKAHADQITANQQSARISRALAEQTDAQAPADAARVSDAVAAYARGHAVPICLRAAGAGLLAGAPGVPGADHPTQGSDGANLAPELVAVPRADLDGFAANTRDLDELRAFLAALIRDGVATTEQPKGK